MVLTGRAKDTIVLSSGENIEPSSIEDAAVCSPLIKFCVLLGQDRRSLGALVVPDPEAWEELEKEKGEFDGLSITASSECSLDFFLRYTIDANAPCVLGCNFSWARMCVHVRVRVCVSVCVL